MKKSIISCITIFIYISFEILLKKIKTGVMEHFNNLICDAISTLRSNKKRPNENAIYSIMSSNLEFLSKEQLEEQLNSLLMRENLKTNHIMEKSLTIWTQIEPICLFLLTSPSNTSHR